MKNKPRRIHNRRGKRLNYRQRQAWAHAVRVIWFASAILKKMMISSALIRSQRKFPPGGAILKTGTVPGQPVTGEFIVPVNAPGAVTFLEEPVTTWKFDYQIKGYEKTNP